MASAAAAAPLAISNSEGLSFGRFAAGSGGSVVIAPSGARSVTGSAVLLSSGPGAAARFEVSGDPDRTYSVTLPANGAHSLSRAGANAMPLTNFSSSPGASGQLNASGKQTLTVGASLNVGPGQPSGSYSGSFTVYVDYN